MSFFDGLKKFGHFYLICMVPDNNIMYCLVFRSHSKKKKLYQYVKKKKTQTQITTVYKQEKHETIAKIFSIVEITMVHL